MSAPSPLPTLQSGAAAEKEKHLFLLPQTSPMAKGPAGIGGFDIRRMQTARLRFAAS